MTKKKGRSPPFTDARRYEPTAVDIAWAQTTMARTNDGGVLAFPSTELVYKVDHANKALVLQNTGQLENPQSFWTHLQTIVVFNRIGYQVIEKGSV